MLFVHKVWKNVRCLHWSTIWVIIYLFIIGFVLHNITYKLKNGILSNHSKLNLADTQVAGASAPTNANIILKKSSNLVDELSANDKRHLKEAFKLADKNKDNELSLNELAQYMHEKILVHIVEAMRNNPREFREIDISPADGMISWDEYHVLFLKEHNITAADIDEDGRSKNRKARDDMLRDKRRWGESARTDLFSLTIDEYLAFRHPESSVSRLLELVEDVLRQFDIDGDEMLTLAEFSDVNLNDDAEMLQKTLLPETAKERKVDFQKLIDMNHDGKADRGELLHYVDPKTPRYALREASKVIKLSDNNHDGSLSFKELIENADIVLNSKIINIAKSFHIDY